MSPIDTAGLSVVATTDDERYLDELAGRLGDDVQVIGVSTRPIVSTRARLLRVFDLEAAYSRNRGLQLASAPVVAFLEDGQLPAPGWRAAVTRVFAAQPHQAAALPASARNVDVGGNVAYDRLELLDARGFPLYTGAPAGSAVPDLLLLSRLEAEGRRVARVEGMTLERREGPGARDDARRLGRALRTARRPAAAARAALSASRSPRRLRDLFAGLLLDRGWRFDKSTVLAQMPAEISAALGDHPLGDVHLGHKGKIHCLARAGDRVVHVYVDPTDHLREAVAARVTIRERIGEGVPQLHAAVEGVDSLWVVEDFVAGRALDAAALAAASDRVARWVVKVAGPPGPPLGQAAGWAEHAAELSAAGFPAETAAALEQSLRALERIPARHLHGDLSPRNVIAEGDRLTGVDWENAALEFLPGLDLVYLFLLADGAPNERVVLEPRALAPSLRELGVEAALLPHAFRVMLATWALGERKRRARLGVDPGPQVFEPLFFRCERLLR